jgi:hypothetical protein
MNDKEQEIKKLKTRRFNLREKIRACVKKGKNAYDYVIELHEVLAKLRGFGINVSVEKDYLQIEYWNNFENSSQKPIQKPKHSKPIKSQNNENKIKENKRNQDSFSLCLAWTSIDGCPTPIQVQKVKEYFEELCMELEDESSKVCGPGCTEHILKYKFEGSEESFRLLKICTQFVLDTFAESDFDKFNIAVYGKRKNY